eukprot:CAMPEP_0201522668 /NCGR_PEP_ID=MMETSP0161_2-20130828/18480_1 /ASSEMBLY_ACC=CAM_ASM_000251 /TAXON_ID=180227 /ORGANISM="Neoparamoeba aestuarina, Strain SoJaBio B1-5/56/2" /LENGTH=207 /DNA_ID=CAMNT_0047921581 /DNA_START=153 /DNA_END=776 /DNA_ORIENTATION=+
MRQGYCTKDTEAQGTEKHEKIEENGTAKKEEKDAATEGGSDKVVQEKDEHIAKLKKELMYALADAQNARRVAADDVRKAKEFGVKEFAKDIIEVVDCLDGAVNSIKKLDQETANKIKHVATGISMTLSVMMKNLERNGVKSIPLKVGEAFDYNFHEALYNYTIKPDETLKEGQVASIVKTGYMLNSRILRAAQVGVAQKPAEESPKE